jgi:hypothetical protein
MGFGDQGIEIYEGKYERRLCNWKQWINVFGGNKSCHLGNEIAVNVRDAVKMLVKLMGRI